MRSILLILVVGSFCLAPSPGDAAPSCDALHQQMYGSSGTGGIAARYKALKVKLQGDERAGRTSAVAADQTELQRLATSIVADAKAASAAHCPLTHVASATPTAPSATPFLPPGVTGPVVITMRSTHGCVGFEGTWTTPSAPIRIRGGGATLGSATFAGTVNGSVFRGRYSDPQIGTGTFVFTLSDDRDSFDAALQKDSGQRTAFSAVCAGQ